MVRAGRVTGSPANDVAWAGCASPHTCKCAICRGKCATCESSHKTATRFKGIVAAHRAPVARLIDRGECSGALDAEDVAPFVARKMEDLCAPYS